MALTEEEKRDPVPAAHSQESSPNPDQTAQPSSPEPSEDHANPEGTTPEQEARQESEERIRGLLEAYQETLDTVEDLPAVVWVPWDRKGPGSYFKVPYLDRKSTRLNSSHANISYAVFCLKKKKKE